MRIIHCISVILLTAAMVSGCSTFRKPADQAAQQQAAQKNAEQLYRRAFSKLQKARFEGALEDYNQLIIRYPFGALTEQAKLDRVFVLNRLRRTADAITAVESFIEQHPVHPNIDYAYYMRGIVSFEKRRNFIEKQAGGSQVSRNKNNMEDSYQAFEELIQRYPASPYVADAEQRMVYLLNSMASYELGVAKFYAERNAHIAAINRCNYIIDNYDRSPAVVDALKLMANSYQELGLSEQAEQALATLKLNYGEQTESTQSEARGFWAKLPKLPRIFGGKSQSN